MPGWKDPRVRPYPDRPGVSSMPAGNPTAPAPVRKTRKSPGLPSTCAKCRNTRRGYCQEHRDDHESYDPVANLGLVPQSTSMEDRVRWEQVR
jgi:hypothetical protein